MFSHVVLGTNDIAKSKEFYDAVLGAIGGAPGVIDGKGRVVYRHRGQALLLTAPLNGEPACISNGFTLGFNCSISEIHAWHEAGLAHGGSTCEDPPGPRAGTPFYLAYMRDPDGHKLCALHFMATPA